MSILKKLLALTLALAMILSVSAFAGYSAEAYADAAKIDEDCEEAVELLYALNIMKGDGKNFNPEAAVTRAEMAKMIYVILNKGDADAGNYIGAKMFSDIEVGAWYEGYVNYAAATKLVQGRPDGTFGPMDPVTTAEAAKMLLTAIGYSAEARGYVGANWDKNVLSDAAIIGLLKGYNTNVATYAPRQWVAVMMANAMGAYTYTTVAPAFTGLLTNVNADSDIITMGAKYFHLDAFEKVAVATENVSLTGKYAGEGEILFSNGEKIKKTGLGALDLGQTYVVIYNTDNMKAYSVRSTSDVAEAHVHDMDVEVKYGTSSNKAANKYEFTIDEMVAKFDDSKIPVIYTGTEYIGEDDVVEATKLDVEDLYDAIEDEVRTNDTYKAIDTDADGTIDYMIVVEYDYAQVTKDGSHNKYGDYVELKNAAGEVVKFDGLSKLYLKDAIVSEDELEKGDVVKYTWNLDAGKYELIELPYAEDATYEARDNKKEIYTIDGEDYMVADNAYVWGEEFIEWLTGSKKLGKTVSFVYDGDMLISHWFSDSDIDDLAVVNEMLALVVDVDAYFSTGTLHEKEYIEYMTIDGETHIAEYVEDDDSVAFADLIALGMDKYDDAEDLEGRLFVYELDKKERVTLYEIDLEDMDVSEDLLNVYEEKDGELDATESSVKFDGDKMAADNTFFYAYDDDGEAVFGVITPAEMGDGKDAEAYGQVMSYEKSKNGRTTVMAGYVVFDLTSDWNADYLYITEIGRETADGLKLTVDFIGGESDVTIYVDNDKEYYTDLLYGYTYYTMDDEYVLTLVEDVDGSVEWYDEEDTEICLKNGDETIIDVSDDDDVDHIVVVTIEYVRDETQTDDTDGDYLNADLYEEYDRILEIVAYEDLEADAIEDGADTDSYEQDSFWYYDAKADLIYIVVLHDMTQAQ